ncbi:MAG: hypothetical protein UR26_C0007G0025 [candidate division TM6 bacterium GW2011_GWF2_32_72]|nr:MAG: hypothetical protein UR26_C0007G0025 [candidate division TM6 bacterium GW2011_GWF2_32_72]
MKKNWGWFVICSMTLVEARIPLNQSKFLEPTRVNLNRLEDTFEKADGIPLTLASGTNTISSSGVYYIDNSKSDADITISSDNVVLNLRGRLVQSINVAGSYVKVQNGNVAYSANTAVSATGVHDIFFEDLIVENSGSTGTTYAVTFSMCKNVGYSNINMYGDGAQLLFDVCTIVDVSDLKILGTNGGTPTYGIRMNSCPNISCRNVSIANYKATTSTFYVYGASNFVMENVLTTSCSASGSTGVLELSTCSGGSVKGCSIKGSASGGHGILVNNCLATTFDNCSAVNANLSGFYLTGNTSSILVTNCLAASNGSNGFAITVNGTVDLYNCISTNNTSDGIIIDGGSRISIDNCSCVDNNGNGITMEDSLVLDCTIENSSVTGNGGHGILVQDNGGGVPKQGAIINNYVASNTSEGIYLRSTGIFRFTVASNKCIGNSVGIEQPSGSTASNAVFNNVALANTSANYVNVSAGNRGTLASLNTGTQTAWANITN